MLKFPIDKVKWALFKGREQEGPLLGTNTLFVVGDAPIARIYHFLDVHDIQSVYFGAGGRFDYNIDTVFQIVQSSLPFVPIANVTIESPIFFSQTYLELMKRRRRRLLWIIPYIWHGAVDVQGLNSIEATYSEVIKDHLEDVYLKVDTGTSVVISALKNCIYNSYDVGYDKDVTLEQQGLTCE